jgi:hypothetical protein
MPKVFLMAVSRSFIVWSSWVFAQGQHCGTGGDCVRWRELWGRHSCEMLWADLRHSKWFQTKKIWRASTYPLVN